MQHFSDKAVFFSGVYGMNELNLNAAKKIFIELRRRVAPSGLGLQPLIG